jgi:ribose transport system permease protein
MTTTVGVRSVTRAARGAVVREHSPRIALVAVLAIEAIYFGIASPQFFTSQNLLAIGSFSSVLAIVATGATFGVVSGAIDISVGSVVAISGFVATQQFSSTIADSVLGIGVALGIGIAVGVVNGFAVVKLRVHPIVTTLGTQGIVRGLAYVVQGSSGTVSSDQGNVTLSSVFNVMQGTTLGVPRPLLVAVAVMCVGYVVLHKTRFGLYTFAVGRNPSGARDAALPVDRIRITCLVLSGLSAGAAGWVFASAQAGLDANAAIGLELTVITAVIIGGAGFLGGTGSMIGTALGVVVLGAMTNGMGLLGISSFYQLMGQGVLLLIAVWFDALKSGGYT